MNKDTIEKINEIHNTVVTTSIPLDITGLITLIFVVALVVLWVIFYTIYHKMYYSKLMLTGLTKRRAIFMVLAYAANTTLLIIGIGLLITSFFTFYHYKDLLFLTVSTVIATTFIGVGVTMSTYSETNVLGTIERYNELKELKAVYRGKFPTEVITLQEILKDMHNIRNELNQKNHKLESIKKKNDRNIKKLQSIIKENEPN